MRSPRGWHLWIIAGTLNHGPDAGRSAEETRRRGTPERGCAGRAAANTLSRRLEPEGARSPPNEGRYACRVSSSPVGGGDAAMRRLVSGLRTPGGKGRL